MPPHAAPETEPFATASPSVSGARLQPISPAEAEEFLRRFDQSSGPGGRHVGAWGAFEDGTALIGAAALTRMCAGTFHGRVAVASDRRRLGIGAELLGLLVQQATDAGARLLTASCAADAVEGRRLIASTGLLSARRTRDGRAHVAVFLPVWTALLGARR